MKRMWGGKKPRDPKERFWEKVDKSGECWVWTGLKFHFGHGSFFIGSRWNDSRQCIGAHRFSWELHNGTIPETLCVLHKCDNPPCVNPSHLFLGTRLDNNKDMAKKGRTKTLRGEANTVSKFSNKQIYEIRELYKEGFTIAEISRKFISPFSTIRHIVKRDSWDHI